MKVVTIIACLLALASAIDEETAKEIKAHMVLQLQECAEESNASSEDVSNLKNHIIPTTHPGQCTIFCLHKRFKIQKQNGDIDTEGGITVLGMLKELDMDLYEKLVGIYQACGGVAVDSDPCVTSANWANCAKEEAKNRGFEDCLFE